MKHLLKIGIDVGNFDTKSANTIIASSFMASKTYDRLADCWMLKDGTYYSVTEERNNQMDDKTENGYAEIITLLSIGKELLYRAEKLYTDNQKAKPTKEEIQKELDSVKEIELGVGIPVGRFSSLAQKMQDSYMKAWENGVEYIFCDYHISFKLVKCKVFPQDFQAVWANKYLKYNNYSDYTIIGIGGGTADVIPIINKRPNIANLVTYNSGTIIAIDYIHRAMQHDGKEIAPHLIERVLKGENTTLEEEDKKCILEIGQKFADELIRKIGSHKDIDLQHSPVIFVGGGALLLQYALGNNKMIPCCEFVQDVKANAIFYELSL